MDKMDKMEVEIEKIEKIEELYGIMKKYDTCGIYAAGTEYNWKEVRGIRKYLTELNNKK